MISVEIGQYLNELGIGIYDPDGGTATIFLEDMPDQPDEAICIYTSTGQPPDTKTNVGRPGVQIITRGIELLATMALAQTIIDTLHVPACKRFTSDGKDIILCSARQSEPIPLGKDENGRYEFSSNFSLITNE